MANPEVFSAKTVYDYIRDVSQGINASIDPLLLERNQLAKFTNGTVRGTFPTHRPPYLTLPITYSDPTVQAAFEQGLFQGAGYYKPDFGAESIILQIAGRIYRVEILQNQGTVYEITVPGSPNSASASQVFMWQAEKWMVINDSQNLPVFFDGNSSRRSYGAATQVGTVKTNFTMPAFGSTVSVVLNDIFSGAFNLPLRLTDPSGTNGIVQIVGVGSFNGYPVTLQNISDTAGNTEAAGAQVTTQSGASNIVGTVANSSTVGNGSYGHINFTLTAPPAFPVGTQVLYTFTGSTGTQQGTIIAISGNTITVNFFFSVSFFTNITAGTNVTATNTNSTLVALLNASFTVPAVNGTVTAYFDRLYTGTVPQTVFISGKQYSLTAVQTPSGNSATVTLLNVSYPTGTVTGNATPTLAPSLTTIPELPVGRMGAYGLGRVWMALTDGRSFVAGDIVGGSSGTLAYKFRDAVLKMQENTLLNGGGNFVVPGQVGDIRAMIFTAVLDTSLGQGPLAVCTPSIVFSCQAPVDRTTWQDVTNPILTEGMKGAGALGQNSTIICNSDVMMRSLLGISSYIQGRRDFAVWGNVPSSREVDLYLAKDPVSLLPYSSAAQFDNRMLLTTEPVQTSLGVCWKKLVALNFDPISSLRGKAPSVYDGIWDGLNILQLVKGSFGGTERLFAVCLSEALDKIELHEILPSSSAIYEDDNTTPIVWEYETAAVNFFEDDPRRRNFMRLLDGELRIDQMDQTLYETLIDEAHSVVIEAFYKTDQWPTYEPWHTANVSFNPNADDPGFRPAIGFGEPSWKPMDVKNNRPLREGTTYQFKFRITGHCRVVGHRFKGVTIPAVDFAPPK